MLSDLIRWVRIGSDQIKFDPIRSDPTGSDLFNLPFNLVSHPISRMQVALTRHVLMQLALLDEGRRCTALQLLHSLASGDASLEVLEVEHYIPPTTYRLLAHC